MLPREARLRNRGRSSSGSLSGSSSSSAIKMTGVEGLGFRVGVVSTAERSLEATRGDGETADVVEVEFEESSFNDDRRLGTADVGGRVADRTVDAVELGAALEAERFDGGVFGENSAITGSGGYSLRSKNFRRVLLSMLTLSLNDRRRIFRRKGTEAGREWHYPNRSELLNDSWIILGMKESLRKMVISNRCKGFDPLGHSFA